MKRLLLLTIWLLFCVSVSAQQHHSVNFKFPEWSMPQSGQQGGYPAYRFRRLASEPATCTPGDVYFNIGTATNRQCLAVNTWSNFGSGSGSGTVTNVTGTAPIAVANGTTTPVVSLNDTAVTPGSYTSANITVDQKGRITAAANGSGFACVACTSNVLQKGNGAGNFADSRITDNGTTLELPVNIVIPFGGDVATPDFYLGSNAASFSTVLQGSLTQDQANIAFFGTTGNRFGALQIVMETTDFVAPGLQVASYTQGTSFTGTGGVVSQFGDSGTSGGTQAGMGGFLANPTMLGSRNVTLGVGFQAGPTVSFSTGRFVDYVGFYAGDLDLGDNTGVAYAFRSLVNGAGNFAISTEGTAPSQFGGTLQPLTNGGTDLGSTSKGFQQLFVDATITSGGTTGNQTINKSAWTVNFAAAAASLTVTSNKVTTSSIVICTVQTNDTTLKSVQAVPGSGSVGLFGNAAATAETKVGCWVLNQ